MRFSRPSAAKPARSRAWGAGSLGWVAAHGDSVAQATQEYGEYHAASIGRLFNPAFRLSSPFLFWFHFRGGDGSRSVGALGFS